MLTSLYSTIQASQILQISDNTLRKWRWEGKGPKFVKVGRKVAYRDTDITAFIETQVRRSTSDTGGNSS